MTLFHFGKKKKEKESVCACNTTPVKAYEESYCCCNTEDSDIKECSCNNEKAGTNIKNIKVLGSGCKSCHAQYTNVKEAVRNLGISLEVEYITDIEKIMAYGVMSMPAIVVNEKVVVMGKVLKTADVEKLIQK